MSTLPSKKPIIQLIKQKSPAGEKPKIVVGEKPKIVVVEKQKSPAVEKPKIVVAEKQKSPATTKKNPRLIFTPLEEKIQPKIPTKIIKVKLPGIATTIEQIPNQTPSLVSESAVGITYTYQQQSIYSIEYIIDVDRISEKRSTSKNIRGNKRPYTVAELKEFGRNLKIPGSGHMNKQSLVIAVRTKVLQLKSTGK